LIIIKFEPVAELNQYDAEMLDVVLESFGVRDMLTRGDLMELFDGDEAAAFAIVQLLTREAFIAQVGKYGDFELPERLVLKPKGEKFLNEGGFAARYRREQLTPAAAGGTLAKLQQQNFRLQNEQLANESEIGSLQKRIAGLQYLWWLLIVIALIVGYWWGHQK
jgi:hypothetical protein